MKKLVKLFVVSFLAISLAACGSKNGGNDEQKIVVGATAVPHAEILNNIVKDVLAQDGYTLEVVEFSDYVQPNRALEDGELDANYFQTLAYLKEQNKNNNWHLVEVQGVHYEAMALYSKNYKSLSELKDGDLIGIPNDGSNEDRALNLLASAGIIEYTSNINHPLQGITKYNVNVEFVELEAANIPNNLADCAAIVVNGNYALESKLNSKANTLVAENFGEKEAAPYVNYLAVKEGNETSEKTKALIKAITDDKVKAYIEKTYGKAVVATY